MEKILVIKHGAFGDFIHQLRYMKTIRSLHNNAEITLITASSQQVLAKATRYFDKIVIDDRNYTPKDWYRIIKKTIVDGHFNFIYNLQGSARVVKKYLPLARIASDHNLVIRYPAKCQTEENMREDTIIKKHAWTWGKKETKTYHLDILSEDMSFCTLNEDIKRLLPKEKFVLLIPGCSQGHDYKRWAPENYGKLAFCLQEKNIASVIIGTATEKENIEKIIKLAPQAVNLMNKTQMTDIPPLGGLAFVTIGNDTGPTHFVATSKHKTIALFGPQTAKAQDKSENVINFVGQDTINDIKVDEVLQTILSLA